jgi:hypothetical protein
MSIVVDVLTGGINNHETTSEAVNGIATDFIAEGIVDTVSNTSGVAPATGGYAVNAQGTPAMAVDVSAGVAYVDGVPSTQGAQTFRVKNSGTEAVTISANSSGSTKYDWVYITLNATNLNAPNTAGDNVATLTTSRSSSASTDDGTPPTYGYAIAVVTVANGASSITNSMIRDVRTQAAVSAGASSAASTWTDTGYAPGTVTYNGNRSYQLIFSNTDLTGFLSNGMRLKLTRTTPPPTQCTDLEASSSQYWSKTSPAGISFTTTFTCSAWVKLESYGAIGGIIARRNGTTEGWSLNIDASGSVVIIGQRIAANNKSITSYQSIPLNKWVHVAACLDMTVGDTSAQKIWIDGVEVPRSYSLNGTATALVQGTTALVVGARTSAGGDPFDGKIAQASVHSACLSDAQIKAMASQTISSSTPSIVSGFTMNGVATDVTANANDLTAVASAGYSTDSPMNATEYGIITANSFSTNTTLTVQVPEGYAIPTSGGVSAVAYSTQDVPYGFPRDKGKWRVSLPWKSATATTSNATFGSFSSGGFALTVPIGAWNIGWCGNLSSSSTTLLGWNLSPTALTGLSVTAGFAISRRAALLVSSAAANYQQNVNISIPEALSAATTYVMYTVGATANGTLEGTASNCEVYADLSYV